MARRTTTDVNNNTNNNRKEESPSDAEILAQIAAIRAENEALKRDLQTRVAVKRKAKKTPKRGENDTTTNQSSTTSTTTTTNNNNNNTNKEGKRPLEAFAGELPDVYVGGDSEYTAKNAAKESASALASAAAADVSKEKAVVATETSTTIKQKAPPGGTSSLLTPGFEIDPIVESESPKNIVFVTSEVAPWSKTGGLADVCGSSPQA